MQRDLGKDSLLFRYKTVLFFIGLATIFLLPYCLLDHWVTGEDLFGRVEGDKSGVVAAGKKDLVHLSFAGQGAPQQWSRELQLGQQVKWVKLSAQMASQAVVAGEKPWNAARLLLVQYKDGKPRWDKSHSVATLVGTQPWQEYSKVFPVAVDTEKIRIVAQLSRAKGDFFLKGIRLVEVTPVGWFRSMQVASLAGWLFFIGFLFLPYLKKVHGRMLAMLAGSMVVVIIIGTALPGPTKNVIKRDLEQQLGKVVEFSHSIVTQTHEISQGETSIIKVQGKRWPKMIKVAHFVLFAVAGVLFALCFSERSLLLIWGDLLLLAGATELLQLYVEGRSPLLMDVVIDGTGALVGVMLAALIRSPQQTALAVRG